MEVKNRMAGRKVRCVECDRLVRVPDDDYDDELPRRRPIDEGLSTQELLMYGLICLFIPGVNVLVTSVLYYAWAGSQPKRASQINMLGFAIFGLHLLIFVPLVCLTKGMEPR
jgi:hypothetical protein